MNTFGNISVGTKFIFKGRFYTKIDSTTGVSIQANLEKVHFFAGSETIEVDNQS